MLVDYQQNIITITKSDILDAKRERQARELKNKLRSYDNIIKPCFIWTFNNGPVFPYGGWWLYIRMLKHDWCISRSRQYNDIDLTLKIMALYPCGFLPMMKTRHEWMREFARHYPKVTAKRPRDQGMALAQAVYEPGYRLIDVRSYE